MKMKSKKTDWESIDWRKVQLRIWRIQIKIYNCSKKGNEFEVVKFQKILFLRKEEPCEEKSSRTVLNQG